MVTFLIAFVGYTAAGAVLWIPLAVVGRRKRRTRAVNRYLVGAAAMGMICAVIAASSERLVNQCRDAGNPTCYDFGATGLQLLFLGGYGFAVLLMAWLIHRD